MSTVEYLCRRFSRIGARLKIHGPDQRQRAGVRIDVGRDHHGEFFDIRCQVGVTPEVIDVRPDSRHLVLMVRERKDKNKFLLGHDERHWFVSAVPGDGVHDVRTAIASLRPAEARSETAIRQGEWFFLPAPDVKDTSVIHRSEPLSRGAGSKPHICEELMRHFGVVVMVTGRYPNGISEREYNRLIDTDPKARRMNWKRMVRDAEVYARGSVRHRDHKTVHLDGWHRVYMNRERFARHAVQIAFLD